MTNIDRDTERLANGTVWDTYASGPFVMEVFDRRESENHEPSHVIIRPVRRTCIGVGVMPGLDETEPNYLLETRTSSRVCDLGILIEDATIARDTLAAFRDILLANHQITTTLNGQ